MRWSLYTLVLDVGLTSFRFSDLWLRPSRPAKLRGKLICIYEARIAPLATGNHYTEDEGRGSASGRDILTTFSVQAFIHSPVLLLGGATLFSSPRGSFGL